MPLGWETLTMKNPSPFSARYTLLALAFVIIASLILFQEDAPTAPNREGPLYCHSDGRCTTAAGAFWAEDSVRRDREDHDRMTAEDKQLHRD